MLVHKHHIIPRHSGGSDDSSNIVELTVEEHAEAHRKLYEQYGNEYDNIAWLGLSKQIGKEEATRHARQAVHSTGTTGKTWKCKSNPDVSGNFPNLGHQKGKHWYTDGTRECLAFSCPPKFGSGRLIRTTT